MRRRSRRSEERRKRFWLGMTKLAFFLVLVGATGFYAYRVGTELARSEVTALQGEVDRLSATSLRQTEEIGRLEGDLGAARKEAAEFKGLYEAVAPNAEVRELVAQVRAKLDAGLDATRLGFFIAAADRPRDCDEPVTKRFILPTPNYAGGNDWVRFGDVITVSGAGVGGNGGREQWFDPEQPVTLTFTAIGGKESKVTGKLPLQHAMVVKNEEHRFTAAPGASRGFVEITADKCAFVR